MRAILIDWIVEVHMKFKLVPPTLYLAVQLIDRWVSWPVRLPHHCVCIHVWIHDSTSIHPCHHPAFRTTPKTNQHNRYCMDNAVTRTKLQLVGVTALLIACKYEEIYPPEVNAPKTCIHAPVFVGWVGGRLSRRGPVATRNTLIHPQTTKQTTTGARLRVYHRQRLHPRRGAADGAEDPQALRLPRLHAHHGALV